MKAPKIAPAKDSPAQTWRDLVHVSDLFRVVAARSAESEQFDRITVNQARIYGYLFKHRDDEAPIRIKTLAHDLDVTAAAASQAVDRLVRSGMVSRTPDPVDRRAVRLSLTPRAVAFMREHERQADALLADIATRFSSDDFATFCRVLAGILVDLEERWQAIIAEKKDSQ
jgi:DNA-binding MarR family transcriptional regulator